MSGNRRDRRPRIGVTCSVGRGRIMWWFNRFALRRVGAEPVRLCADSTRGFDGLDGLVVGGGDDIVPTLYGGEIDPAIRLDPERDALELEALTHASRHRLPVLGICRGAQMLNVALGGSLHQDAYATYQGSRFRWTVLPRKTVEVAGDTLLARVAGTAPMRVNALHTQAVDRLGPGLRVAARDEGGMAQAIERDADPFALGVQWHPEHLFYAARHRALFAALVAAARAGRGGDQIGAARADAGG